MFNIFKKSESSVIAAEIRKPISKTNYPTIVDEIHNEFFTAGENILYEAQSLLKECETKDLKKGERLAALGFNKTREAVVSAETKNKISTTKEIADLVMYYRVNYPNNKFITEEQVKSICEKYNLVCGVIGLYKGFVPECKLTTIENFSLLKKDKIDMSKPYYFTTINNSSDDWVLSSIAIDDIVPNYIDWLNKRKNGYHYTENALKNHTTKCRICSSIAFPELMNDYVSLHICAPAKDMDLTDKEIKNKYKVNTKIHIPDPVVLQPVKGGYLIICAWGDESSDELVVNEIHN